MPKHSEGARKPQSSRRESAAETRSHAKQKSKATRKATQASNSAVARFEEKLKKGESVGAMFLAEVTSAPGGGRFHVKNLSSKENLVAHLTPALSVKRAKYRDSFLPISVREGSHVLVDGDIIKAVVSERKLSALREEEEDSNSMFSRGSQSSHGSRGRTRKNRR